MTRLRRALLAVLLLTGLSGTAVSASPAMAGGVNGQDDFRSRLEAIPGITVVAEKAEAAPYRFFELTYKQPVDHRDPAAGMFNQRLTLLHRDTTAPMVLYTTGYFVPQQAFRSEPTQLVAGNQIAIEQRFFSPSRPDPADWSKLTIWQGASDHHRIVEALKPLYTAKWISAGVSGGGMASIYHRRFYPADVAGTVAYGAPNDVQDAEDSAYDRFLETVGTDPACRTALNNVQIEALRRRTDLVARYDAWARENAMTFTIVRGVDRAFEFMVNNAVWAFWQYSGQGQCAAVPSTSASSEEIFAWLTNVFGLESNTDEFLTAYAPYFFKAASELGYPTPAVPHLAALQRYRGQDVAAAYVPSDLHPRFRPEAMPDIDGWVKRSGRDLLFVYGQDDPWAAEPFRLAPGTPGSASFTVPRGNHTARIKDLRPAETDAAKQMVRRWAGLPATGEARSATTYIPGLDDYRPETDRRISR